MTKTVLVLGEDTRSFLTVIRSLAKLNYQVDVVCYDRSSPALGSKYIRQSHFLNYQAYTQTDWLAELLALVKSEQYDALFPCDERAIFPLHENKKLFPNHCQLAIPNQEVIEHLFDKNKTKLLSSKHDIPVARGDILTIKDKTYAQLKALFGPKFVIKPTLSFKSEILSTRQKVSIVTSAKEFATYTQYVHQDEKYLVEAFFTGTGEGISVFAVNGKIQYLFAHTRVNEPRSGGGSSYRKAIDIDDEMASACVKLCNATKFDGVGMFEFKRNQLNGSWILVEVNARFWGSLPLAVHAGIDFPGHYARYLFGQCKPHALPIKNFNTKAYARSFSNDIYDAKAEFEYHIQHQSLIKGIGKLLKRLISFAHLLSNEKIDSYDKQDPEPFKREVKYLWNNTLGGKLKRHFNDPSVAEMQRLMRLMYIQNDVSIKFICYGNIMRSPMASNTLSLLANEAGLSWKIASYGFHLKENRASPENCIKGAKHIGIDLSTHRSKWLSQTEIDVQNDILFIFDEKNTLQIKSFYDCKNLFNLAHFVPSGLGKHSEIADPYGNGEKAVTHCYLLVVEAVKNIFEHYLKINRQ